MSYSVAGFSIIIKKLSFANNDILKRFLDKNYKKVYYFDITTKRFTVWLESEPIPLRKKEVTSSTS